MYDLSKNVAINDRQPDDVTWVYSEMAGSPLYSCLFHWVCMLAYQNYGVGLCISLSSFLVSKDSILVLFGVCTRVVSGER